MKVFLKESIVSAALAVAAAAPSALAYTTDPGAQRAISAATQLFFCKIFG
jgi:hypothetical protein